MLIDKDNGGWTPIHFAAQEQVVEIARTLIELEQKWIPKINSAVRPFGEPYTTTGEMEPHDDS